MSSKQDNKSTDKPAPTLIEWSARIGSALGLMALFGFLAYGASQPHIGPNFVYEIKRDQIEQRRNGWAVPLTITNKGTVAIGEVLFEVRMQRADTTAFDVKRGRVAIFGAGESVDAEVWFDEDPRDAVFEFRIDAYSL